MRATDPLPPKPYHCRGQGIPPLPRHASVVTLWLRVVSVTVGPQHDTEALENRALSRTAYEGRVPYVLLEYAQRDILLFTSVMSLARGSRFRCGPLIGVTLRAETCIQSGSTPCFLLRSKYPCRKKGIGVPIYTHTMPTVNIWENWAEAMASPVKRQQK